MMEEDASNSVPSHRRHPLDDSDDDDSHFPQSSTGVEITEHRVIFADHLSESDFEDLPNSGLPYGDHDYYGANAAGKCLPEPCKFPVLYGISQQYLKGETSEPSDGQKSPQNGSPLVGGPSKKTPVATGTAFRTVKADEFPLASGPSVQFASKSWSAKIQPNVTLPKKSGRPPKNEPRDVNAGRLMGRLLMKQGMEHLQQSQHHQGGVQMQAPMFTPARGQTPKPRGRGSTGGARREIVHEEGTVYSPLGVPQQGRQANQPYRTTALSPRKQIVPFRSADEAQDAHSREMMEAAQNALAPSNATISGHNVMMAVQQQQQQMQMQPVMMNQLPPTHQLDERGDVLPRTPGKMVAFSAVSPLGNSSPSRRTHSESNDLHMQYMNEPLRMNADGMPVTPGGGGRKQRPRLSTSESTASGSLPLSPHDHLYPTSPSRHSGITARVHPSPGRMQHQMKSPHMIPVLPLAQGPSTMVSAQLQMSSNAPMPTLHSHAYHTSPAGQRQQQHLTPSSSSARAVYYDSHDGQAAPLISTSGSNTYIPRRRKEKDHEESVEAQVNRNVKTILQAEKLHREPSTSSHHHRQQPLKYEMEPAGRMRHKSGSRWDEEEREEKRKSSGRSATKRVSRLSEKIDTSESEGGDVEDDGNWEVSCLCGQTENDGEPMVGCDTCNRWQHVDCLFPFTKTAPKGSYRCTFCLPRKTDITPEAAREYQQRVKEEKAAEKKREEEEKAAEKKRVEEEKQADTRKKLEDRRKMKDEKTRKQPASNQTQSRSSAQREKPMKTNDASPPYTLITKNEYSQNMRRLLVASRGQSKGNIDILRTLKNEVRSKSMMVSQNTRGIVTTRRIDHGSFIAEICGFVSLQKEVSNSGKNDLTFLFPFKRDEGSIIIDTRKTGNEARYIRRSCKPNAELREISSSTDIHIMIVATQDIGDRNEVTIPWESEWKKRARPAQECACDAKNKDADMCEIEQFFKDHYKLAAATSSSRRSLPANGVTPKGSRSPQRSLTEQKKTTKKKGGLAKKVIMKKGKMTKKSVIKLGTGRKPKGGSTSTAEETEEEQEYEESTEDEKEKEIEEEKAGGKEETMDDDSTPAKRRRNNSEVKRNADKEAEERKKKKMEEEKRKQMEEKKKEERRKEEDKKKEERRKEEDKKKEERRKEEETKKEERKKEEDKKKEEEEKKAAEEKKKQEMQKASVKKGVRKSGAEKGEEEKSTPKNKKGEKVKSEATLKKESAFGKMDYTLPSERNKPSREERKMQALSERLAREDKKSGKQRGSWTRGRSAAAPSAAAAAAPSAAAAATTPAARPKETTGRGKRKGDGEEETEKKERTKNTIVDATTSSTNSLNGMSPKKRMKGASVSSSSRDCIGWWDTDKEMTIINPIHLNTNLSGGKKHYLLNKVEKEKAAVAAESNKSTPTRTGKRGGKKEDTRLTSFWKEQIETSRIVKEFSIDGLPPLAPGVLIEERKKRGRPSNSLPPPTSTSTILPPSTPSTSIEIQSTTTTKGVGGKKLSFEEYKRMKMSGGGEKKGDDAINPPKKNFMPTADITAASPSSLPYVHLPGLEESVGREELKRRVYGDGSPRKGVAGPRTPDSVGKTEPAPKRQSINDRLKNEFSLSTLSTPTSLSVMTASTVSAGVVSSSSSSAISPAVTAPSPLVTPTSAGGGGGSSRPGRPRLSEVRSADVKPPGLIEPPRPTSINPSPSATLSTTPTSSSSSKSAAFLQRAASIRSSK